MSRPSLVRLLVPLLLVLGHTGCATTFSQLMSAGDDHYDEGRYSTAIGNYRQAFIEANENREDYARKKLAPRLQRAASAYAQQIVPVAVELDREGKTAEALDVLFALAQPRPWNIPVDVDLSATLAPTLEPIARRRWPEVEAMVARSRLVAAAREARRLSAGLPAGHPLHQRAREISDLAFEYHRKQAREAQAPMAAGLHWILAQWFFSELEGQSLYALNTESRAALRAMEAQPKRVIATLKSLKGMGECGSTLRELSPQLEKMFALPTRLTLETEPPGAVASTVSLVVQAEQCSTQRRAVAYTALERTEEEVEYTTTERRLVAEDFGAWGGQQDRCVSRGPSGGCTNWAVVQKKDGPRREWLRFRDVEVTKRRTEVRWKEVPRTGTTQTLFARGRVYATAEGLSEELPFDIHGGETWGVAKTLLGRIQIDALIERAREAHAKRALEAAGAAATVSEREHHLLLAVRIGRKVPAQALEWFSEQYGLTARDLERITLWHDFEPHPVTLGIQELVPTYEFDDVTGTLWDRIQADLPW